MDKSIRLTNFLVDIFIIYIVAIIIDILLILGDIYFSSVYAVMFLYYLGLETYNGQTIGKRLTKTRVVNNNGTRPNFLKIFIRTVSRFFLLDAISYMFGFERGFHDQISSTTLKHKRKTPSSKGFSSINQKI